MIPTCLLLDVCWLTYVCPSAGSGHGIKTGSPQTCAFIPEPEQSIDVVGIDRPTTALGYWVNTPGHPNFVENVHFHINCRLSVRPLGHPNGLNPTVPRAPFKIPIFDRCAKSVFSLFCRLSVPSLGRPFHHFERQSFQCT